MNIQDIFKIAIESQASDIHLVAGLPPVLRINGELKEIENAKNLSGKEIEQMCYSVLDAGQKAQFLKDRELDLGYEYKNGTRFRINLHFEKNNFGLVARLIKDKIPSMEEIGMPEIVYKLLNLSQGLVLVTGPTGCGKSTTLGAMINYINSNFSKSIITLEDPIEFIFKPEKSIIIQRQLGSDMMHFSEGLKHALRQDPDVIMVGEMRDLETIATTITLAETGHLVFATLHTYSAAQTIDRIIDIFPPHQQGQIRTQLSATLACVISQRLLPKTGGGQIAAREILINTPAVANLIRENKISQIKTVLETASKSGMTSLDQDIKKLYKEKLVNKEDAIRHMNNPETLDKIKIL
jgi:twitching motility protein PilT